MYNAHCLISFFIGFIGTSYFTSNTQKNIIFCRVICSIIYKWLRFFCRLFFSGGCLVIHKLLGNTFFMKSNGFISKICYRSHIEGYAEQSLMVFFTLIYLIIKLGGFMEGYYVHMSNNAANGSLSHIPISEGNSLLPPTPPNPPDPSAVDTTAPSVIERPIVKLIYTQRYGVGDFLRIMNDSDGALIRSIKTGALESCTIERFELTNRYLLNLENCSEKARVEDKPHVGISIPDTLSNNMDFRQFNNSKIYSEKGRIFIKMTYIERNGLNKANFLGGH